MSMFPCHCLRVSISPCFQVSCLCVHVYMSKSPCPCINVHVSMSMYPCPCVSVFMSPFLHVPMYHVYVSMTPCLQVSMFPCFHVSMSPWSHVSVFPWLFVSMSPCFHVSMFLEFRKRKTELKENRNFCLFAANGKLPFVCCKRKRKNGNRRLLFQQTCPSMVTHCNVMCQYTTRKSIRVIQVVKFRKNKLNKNI